jgi:hypothetical protein
MAWWILCGPAHMMGAIAHSPINSSAWPKLSRSIRLVLAVCFLLLDQVARYDQCAMLGDLSWLVNLLKFDAADHVTFVNRFISFVTWCLIDILGKCILAKYIIGNGTNQCD